MAFRATSELYRYAASVEYLHAERGGRQEPVRTRFRVAAHVHAQSAQVVAREYLLRVVEPVRPSARRRVVLASRERGDCQPSLLPSTLAQLPSDAVLDGHLFPVDAMPRLVGNAVSSEYSVVFLSSGRVLVLSGAKPSIQRVGFRGSSPLAMRSLIVAAPISRFMTTPGAMAKEAEHDPAASSPSPNTDEVTAHCALAGMAMKEKGQNGCCNSHLLLLG